MVQLDRRRILIVEDEALVARLLEEMLEDLGHDVVGPASNIETGLKLAGEEELDCAILDMNLGNGTTSTRIAQELSCRGIPFLFSTGYDPGETQEFDKVPRLNKPFGPIELEQALGQLLS